MHETPTRMTRQRAVLLEVLRESQAHPTADELHTKVREKLPNVSLATVYRNLELLTNQGEIRTIELPGMPRRYDGDTYPHYHLHCVECGRIVDIDHRVLPDMGTLLKMTGRFEVLRMRLELEGICEDCRK